jgi:hypothetical protein
MKMVLSPEDSTTSVAPACGHDDVLRTSAAILTNPARQDLPRVANPATDKLTNLEYIVDAVAHPLQTFNFINHEQHEKDWTK